MKKIIIIAFLALLFVSCGATLGSKEVALNGDLEVKGIGSESKAVYAILVSGKTSEKISLQLGIAYKFADDTKVGTISKDSVTFKITSEGGASKGSSYKDLQSLVCGAESDDKLPKEADLTGKTLKELGDLAGCTLKAVGGTLKIKE